MAKTSYEVRNKILLVATLSSFLAPFMGSALNLAIPDLGKDLNDNVLMLNWVITSFLLVSAAFLLPFGRLADMYGRRRIFLFGLGGFALSSCLCGLANSLSLLLVFRFLQGLGATAIFSTGMAILTAAFPAEQRGRVLGLNAAAVYVGLTIGPVMGGYITHFLGWRSIFFLVFLIGGLAMWVAYQWLPDDWAPPPEGSRYDFTGAIIIALSIMALIYGTSTITTDVIGPWIAGAGCLGLVGFVRHQSRVESPLLDIRALKGNVTFVFANLAALINYMATFSTGYLLSLYLQIVRNLGPGEAGTILLIQPLVMAMLSPLAGKLSDRFQPRIVSSVGMLITAVGQIILFTINDVTPLVFIAANLLLLGVGFALFASPNTNAVMSSVKRGDYGVASSTLGTMRLVGQALSMGIVSFLFAYYLGKARITPAMAPELLVSIKVAYAVFAILCVLGTFAALARGGKQVSRGQ